MHKNSRVHEIYLTLHIYIYIKISHFTGMCVATFESCKRLSLYTRGWHSLLTAHLRTITNHIRTTNNHSTNHLFNNSKPCIKSFIFIFYFYFFQYRIDTFNHLIYRIAIFSSSLNSTCLTSIKNFTHISKFIIKITWKYHTSDKFLDLLHRYIRININRLPKIDDALLWRFLVWQWNKDQSHNFSPVLKSN